MKKDYPSMQHPFPIQKQMMFFFIGLLVILGAGIYNYGLYVLLMLLVALISGGLVEVLFAKIRKKKLDGSVLVTPLVYTLVLPPTLPLWIVAVGSMFGVFFGKAIFGGFGKNIFNPAIVGRLFITISFPAFMATMWLDPKMDAITTATPLGALNGRGDFNYELIDLLLGNVSGSIGETFRIGIMIIGLIFIFLGLINWRIPVFFIGTVFLGTMIGGFISPNTFEDPLMSIMVGGVLFGAFFVATDPITSPYTQRGRIYYGIGLGLITIIIRNFAAFPEGVMFAIIIMNALAPQLDNLGKESILKKKEGEAV